MLTSMDVKFPCSYVCSSANSGYITIIPRVRVLYELAIITSYPTSTSRIIVLLKTPTKYGEFFPTFFVKTTDFQLVFNFEQMRTVTIFGEHGVMAHIP